MQKSCERYHLIDSIRGFALINMVAFHLCFDIFAIYAVNTKWYYYPLTTAWERFICVTFILVSGISMNFTHHAYKRGIMLNLFGFVITAVTFFAVPSEAVWFGVLNLLGCAMLISEPLRVYLDRINAVAGMIVSLVLYMLCYGIPNRFIGIFGFKLFELPDEMYSFKWLAFLGFPSADFKSSDYFPIIPWVFLFALGYFLWKAIKQYKLEKAFTLKIPVLNTIGRYSLWIYLAHQPLLFGLTYLIFEIL